MGQQAGSREEQLEPEESDREIDDGGAGSNADMAQDNKRTTRAQDESTKSGTNVTDGRNDHQICEEPTTEVQSRGESPSTENSRQWTSTNTRRIAHPARFQGHHWYNSRKQIKI